MSRFDEINAIVKCRYETGAYGRAHFKMTSPFWEAVRGVIPKPTPARMPWGPPPLDALLAIPIVIDDDLTGDEWRLVDTHTEEILFRGGGHEDVTGGFGSPDSPARDTAEPSPAGTNQGASHSAKPFVLPSKISEEG